MNPVFPPFPRSGIPGLPRRIVASATWDKWIGLGIAFWCATTFLPIIANSTPSVELTAEPQGNPFRYVPISTAVLVLIDFLARDRIGELLTRYTREARGWTMLPIGIAFLLAIFGALLGQWLSCFYAAVLVFLCLHFAMVWAMEENGRAACFVGLFWALTLTVFLPLVLYGLPQNRWVGGIHPNLYSAVVIGWMMAGLLSFRRCGGLLFPIALALAVTVSSRYAMVGVSLMAAIYIGLHPRIAPGLKLLLGLASTSLLLLPPVWGAIRHAVLLDDAGRGLGGGVSGRFDMYGVFWPQLVESPWIGYGFRARDAYLPSHNGYLTLFLEDGVIAGFLIVFWVAARIAQSTLAVMQGGERLRTLVCAGGLSSIALGAFFQPQLINFGDPMGLIFLLLLMQPPVPLGSRRWLSLPAPPGKRRRSERSDTGGALVRARGN